MGLVLRTPGKWWQVKSTPQKVETYTRWSIHTYPLVEVGTFGLPAFGNGFAPWNGMVLLLVCAHAALCGVSAARCLDWTLGRRSRPGRLLWTVGVATALIALANLYLGTRGPQSHDELLTAGIGFVGVACFGTGILALGVRNIRRLITVVLGIAVCAGSMAFPLGVPDIAFFLFCLAAAIGGLFSFTSVFSVWLLNAVYALDEARETRTRLAVAEERLRFGRDLHDVLGRNLAVIALKSELAVQLARRERPEAVEQMIEVQRIAQESQREVREVVRGYREAELGTELSGAQGVLTAAGIECEISGATTDLPSQVQSALGWVVREATTNVLRHGNAARCAVYLRMAEGCVVLTVENDGLDAKADGGAMVSRGAEAGRRGSGSGLAGLTERLSAVGGTLTAGRTSGGMFRVTASVPLPEGTPLPHPAPAPHSVNEVLS